jgi:hypothetical protein
VANRIHLKRRTPAYWRVTLDDPPLNIFGPASIPPLEEIVGAIERDPEVIESFFPFSGEGLATQNQRIRHAVRTRAIGAKKADFGCLRLALSRVI